MNGAVLRAALLVAGVVVLAILPWWAIAVVVVGLGSGLAGIALNSRFWGRISRAAPREWKSNSNSCVLCGLRSW